MPFLSRALRRSSLSFSSPTNHLSDFPVPRTRHLCTPFSVSTVETLILEFSTTDKPSVGFSCSKNKAPLHAFLCLDYRDAHPRAFHHRQTICRNFHIQELVTFAYPRLDQRVAYTGAYHYLFLLPIHYVSEFPVPRIKYLYITLPYLDLRDRYLKAFHHRQTICWIVLIQELSSFTSSFSISTLEMLNLRAFNYQQTIQRSYLSQELDIFSCLDLRDTGFIAFHHRQTICRFSGSKDTDLYRFQCCQQDAHSRT